MKNRIDPHLPKAPDDAQRASPRILIVDDDYAVRRALHISLYNLGFEIAEAPCFEEAISLVRAIRFDAVLLDVNLPGRNGIEICRELRHICPRQAILMLSVRNEPEDRVEALDAGADDYIVKPFHMGELTARIRAALRRVQTPANEIDQAIRIGEISLYPARRVVTKSGLPVHLTPKEFDLLVYLMRHSGLPVNHGRLLRSVWGPEHSSQIEYLRTFVRQLRRKLEDDPTNPRYVLTASHIGYRFVDQTSWASSANESALPRLGSDPVTV